MRMAEEIAREMDDGCMDEEELIDESYLGLASAMNTYGKDASEDLLEDGIREHMRKALEEHRTLYESDYALARKVREMSDTIDTLTKELGVKPTVDEIADKLGITQDRVMDILKLTGEDVEPDT